MKTPELEKLIAQATPLPWKTVGENATLETFDLTKTLAKFHDGRHYYPPREQAVVNTKLTEYAVNNILRIQQERGELAEAAKLVRNNLSAWLNNKQHGGSNWEGNQAIKTLNETLAKVEKGTK